MKYVKVLAMVCVGSMGAFGCSAAPDSGAELEPEASQATEQELSANALTKQQASTVLRLVDNACGDSWCEGNHNYHFDRIECTRPCGKQPGTCRLSFRLFPYDSDLQTGPTYARTCKSNGFTGFASLVDTAADGSQSLAWPYYDALSACIDRIEAQLPAP